MSADPASTKERRPHLGTRRMKPMSALVTRLPCVAGCGPLRHAKGVPRYHRGMRLVLGAVLMVGAATVVALASCGDGSPSDDPVPEAGPVDAPRDGAAPADARGDSALADDAALDAGAPLVNTCGDAAAAVPDVWLADPRLCLTVFSRDLPVARQLAFAPNGDLFVQAAGKVKTLVDADKDGFVSEAEMTAFADSIEGAPELNHGLAFSPDNAFVYASNALTIYRWSYKSGDRVANGPAEVVVRGIPDGGHTSRTLVFDKQGRLYVNVGSSVDIEQDPAIIALRSQVRRFVLPAVLPAGGIDYATGEAFAPGLRNEVGLTFDSKGRMWGVENGSDGISLPAYGDLTPDNPAEEINRLDAPGVRFFGYPLCWTSFAIDGGPPAGTQWAYLGYPNQQTDVWCRDAKNVQAPAAAMQGHWAPLGIAEYTGGSLPWKGDLFVTSHGSSFRSPAKGRLVARAHLVGDTIQSVVPIVGHGVDGGLEQGTWDARPVDIRTGPDGAIYFSDDFGHRVFRLGYRP